MKFRQRDECERERERERERGLLNAGGEPRFCTRSFNIR
mgnify:CR=1 FL=1